MQPSKQQVKVGQRVLCQQMCGSPTNILLGSLKHRYQTAKHGCLARVCARYGILKQTVC